MEKFNHEKYRDNLAEDLKNIPDHKERKEALEDEKTSGRYQKAKEAHVTDVESAIEQKETDKKNELQRMIAERINLNYKIDQLARDLKFEGSTDKLVMEKRNGQKIEWGPDMGEMTYAEAELKLQALNKDLQEGDKPWRFPDDGRGHWAHDNYPSDIGEANRQKIPGFYTITPEDKEEAGKNSNSEKDHYFYGCEVSKESAMVGERTVYETNEKGERVPQYSAQFYSPTGGSYWSSKGKKAVGRVRFVREVE